MKILINNPLARLRERGKWLQAVTFSLFFANPLFAGEPQRSLATLDWTVAETLIALDEQPKAVGDAKNYKITKFGYRNQNCPKIRLISVSVYNRTLNNFGNFRHNETLILCCLSTLHFMRLPRRCWKNSVRCI